MDNILWISLSRMFALGVIILLSYCTSQSMQSLQCDLAKQHPVINKKSNKTVGCSDCRKCKAGLEPEIPCGTPVGIYDTVGNCKPCKNGTYSATEDTKECQICRSEKCFKHQVIEGTCLTDQKDESYCIDKCDDGYVMDNEGTKCEVYTPQHSTTEKPTTKKPTTNPTTSNPTAKKPTTNPTTSNPTAKKPTTNPTTSNPTAKKPTTNPTTSNPTTKKLTTNNPTKNTITTTKKLVVSNNQKDKIAVLPFPLVVVIVVLVFVIILAIILKFTWPYLKRLRTTEPRDEKFEDVELLEVSVEGKDEPVKIIKQEETQETDLPAVNGPHCPETSGGFADSTRNASDHVSRDINTTVIQNPVLSNIANDTNMGYMARTPPTKNYSVVLEMPVQSPEQMGFGPLIQPEIIVQVRPTPFALINQIPPSMHVPNNFNNPDPTKFGCYPSGLYNTICNKFDTGPPFKDANALAAWLDFTVDEVQVLETKENKTDLIIRSWMERRENTVAKFAQILNDNGMTRLADEVNACRA